MKNELFKVTIKVKHKLGTDAFTLGELYGISRMITGSVPIKGAKLDNKTPKLGEGLMGFADSEENAIKDTDEYENKFFNVQCTKRQYKELARTIEKIHPDLCIFDIRGLI